MKPISAGLLSAAILAGVGAGCDRAPSGTDPAVASPSSAVRFVDAAGEAGLHFRWKSRPKSPMNILEISSAGAGWIDYDADGWPDIIFVGPEGCALFRNDGNGRFQKVTESAGLKLPPGRWHGCASGDLDNDGFPDLLITGHMRQMLFRNEAGKRFVHVPGIDSPTWGTSASFFDADRDGLLDILLGSYVEFGPGSPEFMDRAGVKITLGPDAYEGEKLVFFRNLGGWRFREETRVAGFHTTRGRNFGTAVADFDDDGDDDVYVANDEMPGNLYVNDGSGRFVDQGTESGTSLSGSGKRQGGMGVAWGDFNNDLRLDLLVTTFTQEPKSLYRNDGRGFFSEVSHETQLTQGILPFVGFGVLFFDADRDGWLDVAMANGHVEDLINQVDASSHYPQPLKLFLNRDGVFHDATAEAGPGFNRSIVGRALAMADYDNDGDADLLVADLEGAPLLLRNDTRAAGSWLGLALQGSGRSNRQALGAKVILKVGNLQQVREVRTDGSYLACHDPRLLFGWPADTGTNQVTVTWPDGTRATAENLETGRYYRWRQGESPLPVEQPPR